MINKKKITKLKGKFVETVNQRGYVFITTTHGIYRLTPAIVKREYGTGKEYVEPDVFDLIAEFGDAQ